MSGGFRVEHDSMGSVEVPAEALWGAQTQRAVGNFPVSGERIGRDMIWALASVKGAAAAANGSLGVLEADMAAAIHDAAASVARGDFDDHFPVDVFQTGSDTSSNMNANEVIANRAIELRGGTDRIITIADSFMAMVDGSPPVAPAPVELVSR